MTPYELVVNALIYWFRIAVQINSRVSNEKNSGFPLAYPAGRV
jgi:hypothetical protein